MLALSAERKKSRSTPTDMRLTATTPSKKSAKSKLGAPSQHSQPSRKGKRAWRKNIDIQPVEEGLESLRAEERVVGSTIRERTDDRLFVVDTKGDERVRKSLPRYSKVRLTSAKIIAQRSAVDAVTSRATKPTGTKVSRADRERLLRIAKRPRKGPFNSIVYPSAGSAPIEVSYAAKHSGGRDLWGTPPVEEIIPDGLEEIRKRPIKKPELDHPRDVIDVPAVSVPHPGASYNPPVQAHEELVMEAYKVEQRKQEETDRLLEARKKIDEARVSFDASDIKEGVPAGMNVDEIDDDDEEVNTDMPVVIPKRLPKKKTKQQRTRMAKQKAEKHALAERALRKRVLNSIDQLKSLRSDLSKRAEAQQQARLARQLLRRLKLRKGLAGQRLGKHQVPESGVEVQIGEDLSESLRNLKPEGNLFRDRFVSLQQRALLEPRVPVLPKRRSKPKVYERHAWKRFE